MAADGGIFTFGDAGFYGSTGGITLNKPVVGMAVDPNTGGYWLVAGDGGIFSFNAPFLGSEGAVALNKPVVGMVSTPSLDPYSTSANSADVSFPQCSSNGQQSNLSGFPVVNSVVQLGANYSLGNYGTTKASDYMNDPCFAALNSQAILSGNKVAPYIVLWSQPPQSTGETALFSGPEAQCAQSGSVDCQAFDWGFNLSQDAVGYVQSQGASAQMWWLDVELPGYYNLWSQDITANSNVIAGAITYLQLMGYQVGIYSTYYQYGVITGNTYNPGVPIWIAGATSNASCTAPNQVFAGGTPWLVQLFGSNFTISNASGGLSAVDQDVAC